MWRKAVPAVAMSALLLVGCNNRNEGAAPNYNNTPLEDVQRGGDNLTPNWNNNGTNGYGGTTGPNGMNGTGGTNGTNNGYQDTVPNHTNGFNGVNETVVPETVVPEMKGANNEARQTIKQDIKEKNY
ncbi:hypothetical protein WAX74_04300 [Psychrobacillus sp. FJAT-51614]|uniref:Lipoprotein n=1 Tax=Psychrobacillus mangrovi TaxID=3117745 RepID=A0ABU8F284_9BACI